MTDVNFLMIIVPKKAATSEKKQKNTATRNLVPRRVGPVENGTVMGHAAVLLRVPAVVPPAL